MRENTQNRSGMNRQQERSIANDYLKSLSTKVMRITLLKGGLIHKTFLVEAMNGESYVLQGMNTQVFKNPNLIVLNQQNIARFLAEKKYPKFSLELLSNAQQNYLLQDTKGQTWRMFKAITPSKSMEVLTHPKQAFEAAKALSEFHAFLREYPAEEIQASIPGFLDFKNRLTYYQHAKEAGIPYRKTQARSWMEKVTRYQSVLDDYFRIEPFLPIRVIHADPKLSNFLFDANGKKVLALIDWDTIMAGSILYDIGDMIRSFCQVGAEDSEHQTAFFQAEILKEILTGYVHGPMNDHLTDVERAHFLLGAKAVILIQGIRFLSDYLLGDLYYWVEDETHNLRRAKNQFKMLEELMDLE